MSGQNLPVKLLGVVFVGEHFKLCLVCINVSRIHTMAAARRLSAAARNNIERWTLTVAWSFVKAFKIVEGDLESPGDSKQTAERKTARRRTEGHRLVRSTRSRLRDLGGLYDFHWGSRPPAANTVVAKKRG